jgi:hypothetical protein
LLDLEGFLRILQIGAFCLTVLQFKSLKVKGQSGFWIYLISCI